MKSRFSVIQKSSASVSSSSSSSSSDVSLTSAVTRSGAALATISATFDAARRVLSGGDLAPVPARLAADAEIQRVRADIWQETAKDYRKYVRAAAPLAEADPVDAIIAILRKASTYRSRTRFDDAEAMSDLRRRLEHGLATEEPMIFVLPMGGGKVPNRMKTGRNYLPDVTEWMAWAKLAAMARAIETVHAPGVRVIVVPDAGLHTADLGFSAPEVKAHLDWARDDLEDFGLDRWIEIADTVAHLPPTWVDEVTARSAAAARRAKADPDFAASVEAQVASLIFSVNERVNDWSDEHAALVAAAMAKASADAGSDDHPDVDLPASARLDASTLMVRVRDAVFHYVGVNHALRSLDVPGRIVERLTGQSDFIRLTVHAKPGEARPLLTQSNAMARPGLLPMHGLGYRFLSKGRPRYAGLFEVEARVAGRRPVTDAVGRFLFYEDVERGETDVDAGARAAA